ncbi:MAG: hypothetical protein LBO70_03710 [Clostridiales Family XIII bacterium]|nr:hypothetical protein [Clostridiales Family XIII bacterium]
MSEEEKQLFVSDRGASHFDEEIIHGSRVADLNEPLVAAYIANRKSHSRALSKMSDQDILFRTGVTNREGELSRAGAVALGIYPQQFLKSKSSRLLGTTHFQKRIDEQNLSERVAATLCASEINSVG